VFEPQKWLIFKILGVFEPFFALLLGFGVFEVFKDFFALER
jgi:hypothetical protein